MSARLIPGDCRDALFDLALESASFDACITDPPYHLTSVVKRFGGENAAPAKHGSDGLYARQSAGFMGKQWDGGDIAFQPDTWRLVFDVLKPGAHLLAFGGTRTFHRMAVAIEDAGFEIRDCIMWVYGNGFPKSHNLSKGIDARLGQVGTLGAPKSAAHAGWIERGRMRGDEGGEGWQRPWEGDPEAVDRNARQYIPATPEAAAWEGWGTALKPAWEPIIVARKPLVGTLAANVLAHGCGGLNIDLSRIPGESTARLNTAANGFMSGDIGSTAVQGAAYVTGSDAGRWPANLIHDGSPEVLDAFPQSAGQQAAVSGREPSDKTDCTFGQFNGRTPSTPRGDAGSAARFFYSAKASKADRAGSKHPTVKPLALMRYLCNMVTPPGGTVLDPFAGSGSTLQAALECGFSAVGVEREPEYQADIQARLDALDAETAALFG